MTESASYSGTRKTTGTQAGIGVKRPFKTSWINGYYRWVETLPVSAWVFFLLFGILLIGVQILFISLEGGLQDVPLLPVIIFDGFFTPILLAFIYLLDKQSLVALDSMRPVLQMDETELERYRY